MRPVLAIVGAAILVVLVVLVYFLPFGYSSSGDVNNAHAEFVPAPSISTFEPSVPLTVTITGLPPGAEVVVTPCPDASQNAQQCLSSAPPFSVFYNYSTSVGTALTVTLEVQLSVGQPFVVNTTAPAAAGVSFTATIPLWAQEAWLELLALIVGIVLVAVGLAGHKKPQTPSYYVEQSGYAAGPAPSRFCESCGAAFDDASPSSFCTNCGAPR